MLLGFCALACQPRLDEPGEVVAPAGAGVDLREGGPWAVALHPVQVPARFTDVIHTAVYYPSDSGGNVAGGGPWPAVILLQEDGFSTQTYEGVAQHLAGWGMVVVLPSHPRDLVASAPDNALWAHNFLMDLSASPDNFLTGGLDISHTSLVRYLTTSEDISLIEQDPRFTSLTLVGANPGSGSRSLLSATSLLAIDGGRDCVGDPGVGWDEYTMYRVLATVEGMSHPQLAGGDQEAVDCIADPSACLTDSCAPLLSGEEATRRVWGLLTAFQRQVLLGEVQNWGQLATEWTGLVIEEQQAGGTPTPTP